MRRYATGLQLVLLVCAGAASGYLWRAALDPRSTVAPELVLRGPDPTQLFVKPPTIEGHRHVQAQAKRSVHPKTPAKRASAAVNRHEPNPSTELASVSTSSYTAPTQTGPQAKPAPSRSKKPSPRTAPPRPKPNPRTAPPPVAPPVTTTPAPITPPPSAPPSPVVTPPVAEQAASSSSTRPGWGKGDPNHDHTGPPGQSGKGNSKK
jgi:hypothetical protein